MVLDKKESNVLAEVTRRPELELNEQEQELEWLEAADNGETDRGGIGNLPRTGVIHVTSSAIAVKSWMGFEVKVGHCEHIP